MTLPRISRRSAIGAAAGAASGLLLPTPAIGQASNLPRRPAFPVQRQVRHRTVKVNGIDLFYREAGDPRLPTLLLLHGFPSSSHMFRNLMPALADRFHLIAPDYPGFGFSEMPGRERFTYSFDNYGRLIGAFVDALGSKKFGLYIHDYGVPVGLRVALNRPAALRFLVIQNGTVYEEGISALWAPLKAYWADPSAANRERLKVFFGAASIRLQYVAGLTPDQAALVGPESWAIDSELIQRPGNVDLQLDLFRDYQDNLRRFPQFQEFLRRTQPPTLIAWGKKDAVFPVEGARAYLRDLPKAELQLLDGGHFLLETHWADVARLIRRFADWHRL